MKDTHFEIVSMHDLHQIVALEHLCFANLIWNGTGYFPKSSFGKT